MSQPIAKSRWSEEETFWFVELYKQHECLWNSSCIEYRNNKLRQEAYEEIRRDMHKEGLTVFEVRQKIKNLRNTYKQEINKIERSLKDDTDGTKVYRPTIKWFKTMDDVVKRIKGIKTEPSAHYSTEPPYYNLDAPPESNDFQTIPADLEDYVDVEGNEGEELNEGPTPYCQSSADQAEEAPSPASERTLSGVVGSSSTPRSRKRRAIMDSAVKKLQEVNDSLHELVNDDDEFDAFGHYIALSLKKLPLQAAFEAQEELQKTMTKYRLFHQQCVSSGTSLTVNQQQPGIWISHVTTGTLEDMSGDPLERMQN